MSIQKRAVIEEKPFAQIRVYYSGSIKGVANHEPDFAYQLISHLLEHGADVLSEQVGARTPEELSEVFLRRTGVDRRTLPEPWYAVREIDMKWVDEATHLIAVVNGPSHGVGMEIERAILKPQRGLNQTPILCLIHESLVDQLSWMIRGISQIECPEFNLETYKDLGEAKARITSFLTRTK